jgi:hypothetical protein
MAERGITFVVDGVPWPIPEDQAREIAKHLRARLDPTWGAFSAAIIVEEWLKTSEPGRTLDWTDQEESALRIALEAWIIEAGVLPEESMNLRYALFGSFQDRARDRADAADD